LRALPAALRVLRRTQPDIVHVNDGPSCLVWGAAARLAGVPLVWHVRLDMPGNFADRVRLRLADRLVFVADTIRKRCRTAHSTASVTVVNGVDTSSHTPFVDRSVIRAELGLRADACVLGFVGTFNATKQPAWAIEALVQARATNPAVCLVLVGADEDGAATAARLRAQAEQAGVAEAVHLVGYRSDVPRVLPAFDLLLLPSRSEAMPRVVLEAMACAVPAVATRVGGTPEIITHGTNGWLVDAQDRSGFAKTVAWLARDSETLSRAGQAARATVVRRFNHTQTVTQIEAVYDALRVLFS
jgi:glycosyltransferase involved in cell wall biosynthesis